MDVNKFQEIFNKISKEIDEKTIQCIRLDGYITGLKKALAEFDILRNETISINEIDNKNKKKK